MFKKFKKDLIMKYTPRTRGWFRLRERTLAVPKKRAGETNLHAREIPRIGSEAKDGE